jgi:hypothetical protein
MDYFHALRHVVSPRMCLILRVNAGISAAGDRSAAPAVYCKTAAGATTGQRIGNNYFGLLGGNEC